MFQTTLVLLLTLLNLVTAQNPNTPKLSPKEWVDNLEKDLKALEREDAIAWFSYNTDLTEAKQKLAMAATDKYQRRVAQAKTEVPDWKTVTDPVLKRKLQIFSRGGTTPKDEAKRKELNQVGADMEKLYSTAKYKGLSWGGLSHILRKGVNDTAMREAWVGWREVAGIPQKQRYSEYVDLMNLGAKDNGYADAGDAWRSNYETDDFEKLVDDLFEEVKPLYEQLHCYVRAKLRAKYGEDVVPDSTIPAHLTGDMWAQDWAALYDVAAPYPAEPTLDVTEAMKKQKYTPVKVHQVAEGFYTSLGFPKLPDSFWKLSMLEKPPGKEVVCHASAWDMSDNDVRIKMCTEITAEDLETAHHEQGHIYYYLMYEKLPYLFSTGANAGFHEAIGDTTVLSMSPKYLEDIGLLDSSLKVDDKVNLNMLMLRALTRISFLPFGLMIDKYRWQAFKKGEATNEDWWKLRLQYQGVTPPVGRDQVDFDPAAKYHIPASVPYIRYFVSFILQFSFHEALCKAAGNKLPLAECSIYGSKEAGKMFGDMLKKGASQPWPQTLKEITGSDKISASGLIKYFQPLMDWLKDQNKNEKCGWQDYDASQQCDRKELTRCFMTQLTTDVAFEDKCKSIHAVYDCYTQSKCKVEKCEPSMQACGIKC